MNFKIEANSTVIGISDLEHADPSMGMRHGIFKPTESYAAVKPIFDDYFLAICKMPGTPGVKIPDYESISEKINALDLSLYIDGHKILAEAIEINDCSIEPELTDEPIQVTVVVKNSEVYEQHFGK